MSNIYSINNWAGSTLYEEDAIVVNGAYHYYARVPHTSSSNFQTDVNNNLWKGILNYNGEIRPFFEWKLSYNYSLDIRPTVKSIKFGDGYSVDLPDGINNILLPFNASFDSRSLNEYRAILHFLHARNGNEKFFFIPPAPYNVIKKFICAEWQPTQSFYNKYSISVKFEERI